MKGLICGSLSALILTATSVSIAAPVKYDSENLQSHSAIAFNYNVPHITNASAKNNTHFIKIAVVGMSVEDIMIHIPKEMANFDGVKVKDQSGVEIAAKTEISQGHLSIIFDQPVTPGNAVEIQFTGVETSVPADQILLYEVTAKRVGLQGEIPIGTARIDIPN